MGQIQVEELFEPIGPELGPTPPVFPALCTAESGSASDHKEVKQGGPEEGIAQITGRGQVIQQARRGGLFHAQFISRLSVLTRDEAQEPES